MTLYLLKQEMMELLDLMEDEEANVEDTLEMVRMDFHDKLDDYGMVLRQLKADAEELKAKAKILKEEADRLLTRAKGIEGNADRMKTRMLEAMIETGETKLKTALFTYSVRNTESVVIDASGWDIPTKFVKEPVPDKTLIKDYLKKVDSCDFAHIETKQTLMLR